MNIAITFSNGIRARFWFGREIGDEEYLVIMKGFIYLALNMHLKLCW